MTISTCLPGTPWTSFERPGRASGYLAIHRPGGQPTTRGAARPRDCVGCDHRRARTWCALCRTPQGRLGRRGDPRRGEIEELACSRQHLGIDRIRLVLPSKRRSQPGRVPIPDECELHARRAQCHGEREPRHRRPFGHGERPRPFRQTLGEAVHPRKRRGGDEVVDHLTGTPGVRSSHHDVKVRDHLRVDTNRDSTILRSHSRVLLSSMRPAGSPWIGVCRRRPGCDGWEGSQVLSHTLRARSPRRSSRSGRPLWSPVLVGHPMLRSHAAGSRQCTWPINSLNRVRSGTEPRRRSLSRARSPADFRQRRGSPSRGPRDVATTRLSGSR